MNKFSLLTMRDLSQVDVLNILKDAKDFNNNYTDWQLPVHSALVANLFFEPSTRTHYSFESAELQLGCKVSDFNPESSSITKGESLYDTVKTFESIGYKLLVIRHKENEYFKQLEGIEIPILNGGDGSGNHPSQCLLDLYTMKEEFGGFEGLNVLIVGDILHSRVASSNKEALEMLGANVRFSGPREWSRDGFSHYDFDDVIPWADVIMMLRIQEERGADLQGVKDSYLESFGLNMNRYNRMRKDAIIMHPAPVNRGIEIDTNLVECEKSRIFTQMKNGVLVRKALIKRAFGVENF